MHSGGGDKHRKQRASLARSHWSAVSLSLSLSLTLHTHAYMLSDGSTYIKKYTHTQSVFISRLSLSKTPSLSLSLTTIFET